MFEKPFRVIKKDEQRKDFNINCRKEDNFWCGYKALDKDFNEIVDCRFYCTKSGNVSCCIWVHGYEHFSATGKAGGWGYEKKSAALQEALDNAGLKLNYNIHSTGEIRKPLEAIGKWASKKRTIHIVEMYG